MVSVSLLTFLCLRPWSLFLCQRCSVFDHRQSLSDHRQSLSDHRQNRLSTDRLIIQWDRHRLRPWSERLRRLVLSLRKQFRFSANFFISSLMSGRLCQYFCLFTNVFVSSPMFSSLRQCFYLSANGFVSSTKVLASSPMFLGLWPLALFYRPCSLCLRMLS